MVALQAILQLAIPNGRIRYRFVGLLNLKATAIQFGHNDRIVKIAASNSGLLALSSRGLLYQV